MQVAEPVYCSNCMEVVQPSDWQDFLSSFGEAFTKVSQRLITPMTCLESRHLQSYLSDGDFA